MAAIAALAALTVVGLPYAIWLTGKRPGAEAPGQTSREPATPSLGVTIGLAPAFGIGLWSLIAPPLYLLLGASQNWALFASLGMLAAGGVGIFLVFRQIDFARLGKRDGLLSISAMAICLALLIVPMITTGINSVIIRSNPADVITYTTLGESTRTASFDVIVNGAAYDSRPETAVLVEKNLSAAYSARFLKQGHARLGTIVNLGWYAQVTGGETHHLVWSLGVVFSVAMAGAAFAVARVASVGPFLSGAAALAVGLGFWSGMVRDADAISNLQSNAILLALLALRVIDARSPVRSWSISVASGVLLAGFISAYSELAPLAIAILMVEAVVRLLNAARRWDGLIGVGVALAVSAVLIFASGQGLYLINLIARQLGFAATATGPIGGYLFHHQAIANPVEGIAGLPWLHAVLSQLGLPRDVSSLVTLALGGLMLLVGAVCGVAALVDRNWRHTAPVAAAVAGGVLIACYGMFVQHDMYWFLKGMSSAGPIAMILVAIGGTVLLSNRHIWRPAAMSAAGLTAALLAMQISYAGTGLLDSLSGKSPDYQSRWVGGRSFDVTKIEAALRERCPCDLLVNIPPASDWWWAIMSSMSLQEFKPYQQMGQFYDNNPVTFQHTALERPRRPQFAVMAIEDDFVGEQNLGKLILEDGSLRLYEITAGTDAQFAYRTVDPLTLVVPASPFAIARVTPAGPVSPWADIEHEPEDVVAEGATTTPMPADRASLLPSRRVTHVFRETPVTPGDIVKVTFSVWSEKPVTLRSALFRHCNQDRPAPDIDIEDIVVTTTPQTVVMQTAFTVAHDCVRVDLQNISEGNAEVYLTEPVAEKFRDAPAATPPG